MVRHTRHRNRLATTLTASGEGNIQNLRRFFSIIKEQLVKVPHAVKENRVRKLGFDFQVLLHHWRMGLTHGVRVLGLVCAWRCCSWADCTGNRQKFESDQWCESTFGYITADV